MYVDVSCEDNAQEVLGFFEIVLRSGQFHAVFRSYLLLLTPSLTLFEGGDFIRINRSLSTNDSIPPGIDDADFDPEGDLLLLEKLLNDDPSSPLPSKELKFEEI
ncbi:hypothetical protein Tco_1051695 [Tanacetum coccineum]